MYLEIQRAKNSKGNLQDNLEEKKKSDRTLSV